MREDESAPLTKPGVSLRTILLFAALILVAVGQILLYVAPINDEIVFPSAGWYVVAGAALFGLGLWGRLPARFAALNRVQIPQESALLLLALAFGGLAVFTMLTFLYGSETVYTPVLIFWAASGLSYLAAWGGGWSFSLTGLWNWLKRHQAEWLALLLIFGLGLGLRMYELGELPKVIDGDEGRVGLNVLSTREMPLANPFALWENFGALYMQAMYLSVKTFGQNPFALRLLPALGGSLAILSVYLLGRRLAGHRVGLISAFLLATSHTHIHFSRISSVAYIQGTWLVPLELYFLVSGLQKKSARRTAVAGILLAVHYSVYLTAQMMTGILLVYTLLLFLFQRAWFLTVRRQFAAYWGGLFLMLLPELTYILRKSDEFFSRLNADGTLQSGWLAEKMAETGQNAVQILSGRALHAFLTTIYYPSADFYGSPMPVLTFLAAVVFIAGLVIGLARTRNREMLLLNGYFWGITVAIGVFSIPPSADSYRMLSALPAMMIFSALGLETLLKETGIDRPNARPIYRGVITFVLLSIAITNIWTYYLDFAGRCLYGGDPQTRFASYLGNHVRGIQRETSIYLLSNDIYRYGTHESVSFLGRNRLVQNVDVPLGEEFVPVSGEVVIAIPERTEELKAWIRLVPGGEQTYTYDCNSLILLAYEVP